MSLPANPMGDLVFLSNHIGAITSPDGGKDESESVPEAPPVLQTRYTG